MEQIRNWLVAVITVSVVIASSRSLMPPGGVRQIGGLVFGLVLLCVLFRPLCAEEGKTILRFQEEYSSSVQEREKVLEQQVERSRKEVMESFFEAYVVEQAGQLGLDCRAEVDCEVNEDGLWMPRSARLWGGIDDAAQSRMTQLLETELGILPHAQTYYLT